MKRVHVVVLLAAENRQIVTVTFPRVEKVMTLNVIDAVEKLSVQHLRAPLCISRAIGGTQLAIDANVLAAEELETYVYWTPNLVALPTVQDTNSEISYFA